MKNGCQATVSAPVELQGVGIHTGEPIGIRIVPAEAGEGILFVRTDLGVELPARLGSVCDTRRSTSLGRGEARVQTVEHLLAALWAAGVDNARVELEGPEVPILDGSSEPFLQALRKGGIREQEGREAPLVLEKPVIHSEGATHLVALPSEQFRISYTLHYPDCPAIGSQYISLALDSGSFERELAPCRTFAMHQEVEALRAAGLIQGGGLENALVFSDDGVLNPGGLRFKDEPVRHKVLDLIGDLRLLGRDLQAHVIALCSGHRGNVALGMKIAEACGVSDE